MDAPLLDALGGEFRSARIAVVHAGAATGLEDVQGKVVTGDVLKSKIEAAYPAFQQKVKDGFKTSRAKQKDEWSVRLQPVFDEPSAGLDPRARRGLIRLLHELPLTMLVSTHDMLMVRELFPRMVIMDEGQVVADGPTEDLMDDVELLEAHGLERP